MKKRILSIIVALVVVGTLIYHYGPEIFGRSNTAYAVGDLTVDWGIGVGNVGPIFNVENMAPGDSQSHIVTVTNGSTETRPVGIRGIKDAETGGLGDVMDIVIRRDGIDVYGGSSSTGVKTMSQFLSESVLPNFIELGTLPPSETETYDIVVTFQPSAGNEYQNKTLHFNLVIGIAVAVPAACNSININGDTVYGTAGNDRLRGTTKNDLIISFEGNDTVNGGNGNDCIVDLSGNGRLIGGNGHDVIMAGDGETTIIGGNGNDTIFAGRGEDRVRGGNARDMIEGGGGNDRIDGGNGNDVIDGEDGDDRLDGGNGNDDILGGTGDDIMLGGNGRDMLHGEDGVDRANGRLGRDTCIAETKVSCEL